jgi:hypothetical protein
MSPGSIYGRATKQFWFKRASPPESVKHMIGDRKMMITIVWNPHGFHLLDALPKGQKFNASYYLEIVLNACSRVAHPGLAQVSSFMRTMQDLTPLKRLSGFAGKIVYKWRYINLTHRT